MCLDFSLLLEEGSYSENLRKFCVVLLKSTFFLTFCVFRFLSLFPEKGEFSLKIAQVLCSPVKISVLFNLTCVCLLLEEGGYPENLRMFCVVLSGRDGIKGR